MTTENMTNTGNDAVDSTPAEREPESIEESIVEALDELGADAPDETPQTNEPDVRDEPKETKKSVDSDISEAARTLANAKRKGKKVIEAKDLDLGADSKKKSTEQTVTSPVETKFEAPARWPVPDKEEFNKLPKIAQKQVLDFWQGIEGHTTKIWQDLNREKDQHAEINQITRHYAPEWHKQGLTESQAIAELAATHHKLMDPEQRISELNDILTRMQVTPEMLYEYRQSGHAPQPSPNGQNQSLTKEDIVEILRTQQNESQQQWAVQQAKTEIEQVMRELAPDGRYLYPELWDANEISRVKPLVEDIRKTQPQISWAEATKRAIYTLRVLDGKVGVGSPSPNGQRLPNQQSDIERAKSASVSVHGRGNPMIPSITMAPKGERIEDSIRAIMSATQSTH